MNTTVPADPRLRKRAIAVVSITLLTGLVFLYFVHDFLRGVEALASASPQLAFEKLNPIQNIIIGVVLCSSTTLAGLLGHVALRVLRAGQWPPPGFRVVWDTPIRTGRHATVVAVFMLFLAVVVTVYGVLIVSLPGPEPEGQMGVPQQEV